MEEIDLYIFSENGWSVYDNLIVFDEGFEYEDSESSELYCINTDFKVVFYLNLNKCLFSVSNCYNELDYLFSGSNLYD